MNSDPTWLTTAKDLLARTLKPVLAEINELDWKQDLSPNTLRLREHLSAFGSYPGGGFLVFGITPEGRLVGVSQIQSEQIIGKLANIARDGLEPPLQIDHALIEYGGQHLLFIRIPESFQKPIQIKGKSIEESFVRSGGQTRRMSRQEIGQAILNSRSSRYEELDAFISEDPSEILAKLDYSALYALQKKSVPSNERLLIEDLRNQKIIKQEGKKLAITNLGVLVCAKNVADFRGHERRGVRVVFYKGTSRIEAEREIPGKKGYAIGFGNLVQIILSRLPTSEVIKEALRTSVSIYPEVTIRELLANALIHQDFGISGMNPMVEVFSDRMEITNPGKLLSTVSVDRIIDTTPESRNELFARFMRQLGICEERGSGIDRAIEAIEVFGLPPLEFREDEHSFKAIIYTPKKYNKMTQEERIRACYQHCCLKFMCNERMTNASLRKRLSIAESNYPMISKIIKDSIAGGKIKPQDPEMKAKKHLQYIPYWA